MEPKGETTKVLGKFWNRLIGAVKCLLTLSWGEEGGCTTAQQCAVNVIYFDTYGLSFEG